ncbi:hypothetical protein [Lacinutrix cladophorae]
MKIKHYFYDSSVNFKHVSVSKIVLAIILGICSALTIYSFFYILRETFRFMSFGFGINPQVLSETHRNYYNLFFAGLSVVFGNSIALNFIFSKPQRITHRFNSKRKKLLNDQIFLGFNFSYWFGKIGLIFGVFSMCCMDFEFLPYFKSLSFLLLIVLYLESQKSLGMLLNNSQRLKFVIIHFITLLAITFSISRINTLNYKKLDNVMLVNNPIVDCPFSEFYNDNDSWRYGFDIKIEEDKNGVIKLYVYDKKWQVEEIPKMVQVEHASRRAEVIHFLRANLVADRNMKIQTIKKLELYLFKSNQFNVSYTVKTRDSLFDRMDRRGIKKRILNDILDFESVKKDSVHLLVKEKYRFNNTIKVHVGEIIIFDTIEVKSQQELVEKFKTANSKNTAFEYIYQENTVYQDYINVLGAHFQAVDILRKEKQTVFQENKYTKTPMYTEEQRELQSLFPVIILEKFNFTKTN